MNLLKFCILNSAFLIVLTACDDIRKETYPNGKTRFEVPYVNDQKQGLEKEYYESGAIKRETPYEADRRQGLSKEYYEDGTLAAEYPYENGYIEGVVSRYYKNGKLSSRAEFKQNKQAAFGEYFDESGEPATSGSYKDPRDGTPYEWVRVGQQLWVAENLNYATATGSVCQQCNNWGRLYNFENAKTACLEGFHLPTKAEWNELLQFVGDKAGLKLKAGYGWDPLKGTANYGNGKDDFGLGFKAGGAHFEKSDVAVKDRKFKDAGQKAYVWTAEGEVAVFHYNKDIVTFEKFNAEHGASVRCLKD